MAPMLYDLIPAGADPLCPQNVLALATGPLTGCGASTGTRWTVCCKSPLTLTWGDANGSGFFGPTLKAQDTTPYCSLEPAKNQYIC